MCKKAPLNAICGTVLARSATTTVSVISDDPDPHRYAMNTTRTAMLALALIAGATTANAQSLATFGSAEIAGFGEGSALLGTSISTGNLGWGPVGELVGQTYRYLSSGNSSTDHAQAWALSPSVGLEYSMPTGAVQGMVGYTFVSTEFPAGVSGAENGGSNSAFVSAQVNHWGDGAQTIQWLGDYAFKSQYYWTRLRVAQRVAQGEHPIYLGVEGVLQGSQKVQNLVSSTGFAFTIPTETRYEVGPTIEYRVSNDFRVGASGGVRGGNNNYPMSGYARIEFLLLSKM